MKHGLCSGKRRIEDVKGYLRVEKTTGAAIQIPCGGEGGDTRPCDFNMHDKYSLVGLARKYTNTTKSVMTWGTNEGQEVGG